MNHDYAHCVGFNPDCPKECFRAQLVRDLKPHITDIRLPVSWLDFRGTAECMRKDGDYEQTKKIE